jgi:hypothetical protein
MTKRQLFVVAGRLSRTLKPKGRRSQDALAKRWRTSLAEVAVQQPALPDVIPLMDAWIRRLEREAGTAAPQVR